MPSVIAAVIGLGANLGDRQAALAWAVRQCARLGSVLGVSSLYETRPLGGPTQPDYLNAALLLETGLGPEPLLAALLEVERRAGRERGERWSPRVLDLDLLWIQGVAWSTDVLVVPHPRLRQRRFALLPLLDVAPDAVDPADGRSYAVVAGGLEPQGVRLVSTGASWAYGHAQGS